jgi:hypothetical protein
VYAHTGERLGEWRCRFGHPATWSREDRERRERGSQWRCLLEDAVTSGLLIMRPSVFHLSRCDAAKRKERSGRRVS